MNDSNDENVKAENGTDDAGENESETVYESDLTKSTDLKTFLEDSLGQLYLSLCYLSSNPNGTSLSALFSEESEYNNLDKSIEDMDEVERPSPNGENQTKEETTASSTGAPVPRKKKRPPRLEGLEKFAEITPKNQELLRLSLRLNANRPNTPTPRHGTSSNYSDADSGIGTTTPTKRISDLTGMSHFPWMKLNPDLYDNILGTSGVNRNQLTTRSNRSYNFESDSPRKTASFKSNRSLDIENIFLNRLSPTSEFRNFDVTSMQSLTIPMGSSDGRKIFKRSITSPEDLQNLNNK
ncbi:hypothetical protein RUM44_008829 [Polyplax serrata]|uniref:Uncharacterized protein n=1 Tax=Polyplax serrata TaxID=468196 RepID=A0ABR1BBJ3_POLSC